MNSAHTLMLAIACIVSGSILAVVTTDKTLPLMLVGAGTAVLTKAIMTNEAKTQVVIREVEKANQRAEEAMNQTATLRAEVYNKDNK